MSERARAWLVLGVALAVTTALLVYLRTDPQRVPRRDPGPLASPAVAAGTVGGLLPEVTLQGRGGATPARHLRPAILMLVGPACDCLEALRQVVADAAPLRLVTYVVEAGTSLSQPSALAAQSGGVAGAFADADGTLASAYRLRSDAALVLVRRDGVVNQVVAAVGPTLRLDAALRALV